MPASALFRSATTTATATVMITATAWSAWASASRAGMADRLRPRSAVGQALRHRQGHACTPTMPSCSGATPFTAYHFAQPGFDAGRRDPRGGPLRRGRRIRHGMLAPALDLESWAAPGDLRLQTWVKTWLRRVYVRLGVKRYHLLRCWVLAEATWDTQIRQLWLPRRLGGPLGRAERRPRPPPTGAAAPGRSGNTRTAAPCLESRAASTSIASAGRIRPSSGTDRAPCGGEPCSGSELAGGEPGHSECPNTTFPPRSSRIVTACGTTSVGNLAANLMRLGRRRYVIGKI